MAYFETHKILFSLMSQSKQLVVQRRAEVSIRASIRPQFTLYGGSVVGESSVTTIPEVGREREREIESVLGRIIIILIQKCMSRFILPR